MRIMMTKTNKKSLSDLESLLEQEILDSDALSDEDVDRALLALGADPIQMGIDVHTDIQARLAVVGSWQHNARAHMDQLEPTLSRTPSIPATQTRQDLMDQIEHIKHDPLFGKEVATFFRHRKAQEVSNEELAGLLDDLDVLRQIINAQKDPSKD